MYKEQQKEVFVKKRDESDERRMIDSQITQYSDKQLCFLKQNKLQYIKNEKFKERSSKSIVLSHRGAHNSASQRVESKNRF